MKITQLIKSDNSLKVLAGAICFIVFFFGLSFIGTKKNEPATLDLDVSGFNKAFAASSGWEGVRAVATLIRATSYSFNTFYTYLKMWGVFDITNSVNTNITGTNYYLSLALNTPKTRSSTVDAGITYTHSLELRQGDAAGPIVLQLYFDDPVDSGGTDGCLLYVKPYYFPGSVCDISGIFEARVMNSQTVMYISFCGNPWGTPDPSYAQSGRVKVVDDGTNLNISCLAYVHKDASSSAETICPILTGPHVGFAYYTLAFIAIKESPHYSTAMWGWDNSGKSEVLCEFNPNPLNYGHFNAASGFVCDAMSASCPDGAPYPANSSVGTLYTNMAGVAGQEFGPDTISGLSIAFPAFL